MSSQPCSCTNCRMRLITFTPVKVGTIECEVECPVKLLQDEAKLVCGSSYAEFPECRSPCERWVHIDVWHEFKFCPKQHIQFEQYDPYPGSYPGEVRPLPSGGVVPGSAAALPQCVVEVGYEYI